ncbi:MAG TPA: efflux RND transporter periplasmic adaptor subunit [Geminicoccaceae bacterium]|nr:efflux RND transporter periplasmic adaptor subunit [Geminicoccaceae bacterium]
MRFKRSYLLAAGMALGLAGWLASGQIDALNGRAADAAAPAAGREAGAGAAARPTMTVRVRELTAEPVARQIVVNGRTAPARAVEVRAEAYGRVIEVGPAKGAAVEAGEVLVRLDPRDREVALAEAEAALRQREIEAEAARTLGARGFQAETRVAEAEALLQAARAAVARARIELDDIAVRAPFDGVLERRPVEVGDYVEVGDVLAAVIEQDPFLVVGEVAETEVARLRVGMPGRAQLVDGRTVEGALRYVASEADASTRTLRVELEVSNPDGRFAAGTSARLVIEDEPLPAHRVSSALLALDDAGAVGVKAVDDGDVVAFHPARVVRAEADAVWLAGLPERLRLITVGQGFVRAGQRVRPVAEAETARAEGETGS